MNPNLPILYSFRRCPYAMRARLALLASGLMYTLHEVALKDKPAALLHASAKGTVPVLVLSTGEVIDQSLDIMLWALQQHDPFNWLSQKEAALHLIAQCDGDFKFHLDRYKYPNRYANAVAIEHREKATLYVNSIEIHLQKHCPLSYYFNSYMGMYCAGIMPFLRQFANTDRAWFAAQNWPALQTALSNFEVSSTFKAIMTPFPKVIDNIAITPHRTR